MKKMLSIDQVLYTIKMKIPEDDRAEFRNLDQFLKTQLHLYIDLNLPEKYMEHLVVPIDIKNGSGDLPKGCECIIMLLGSMDKAIYEKPRWREEYVGMIEKAHDGCTYTVFAECDQCTEVNCNHPIIMAAQEARDMIAKGSRHMLTRHYYGYGKNKDGKLTGPYSQQYCLMKPSHSPLFGVDHVHNCIGYGMKDFIGDDYSYRLHNGKIFTNGNFNEGKVWVSYLGKSYANDGTLMMPGDAAFYKIMEANMIHEIYCHLDRIYKTPRYDRAERKAEAKFEKIRNEYEHLVNGIDYNELITVLEKVRCNWHNGKDELANRMIDQPDWLSIYEDGLHNY